MKPTSKDKLKERTRTIKTFAPIKCRFCNTEIVMGDKYYLLATGKEWHTKCI